MLPAKTERSVITVGIVLTLASALIVFTGLWEWHQAEQFHENAHRAIATVVSTNDSPQTTLRFKTDQGTVEVPAPSRGFHSPPGTTFAILYEPNDPEKWHWEKGFNRQEGLGLVGGGVVMFLVGVGLLMLGWISRRRNKRALWLEGGV
jgi:hypothetical protein